MTAPPTTDEPVEERGARWGIGPPIAALFIGLVGATLGAAVAAVVTDAPLDEPTLATSVGSLVGMWIAYGLVIGATLKAGGSTRPLRDLGLRFRPIDLVVGVAGGIASSIIVVQLVYFVLQMTSVVDSDDLDKLDDPARELSDLAGGPGFLVLALFVGVGAPIMEEVFFRGFLQPAFIRRIGVPGGLLLTAAIFGAVHFQVLQFPALAAFGLVLGLLAHFFKRLGPAIVAHIVFNALTLVALAAS